MFHHIQKILIRHKESWESLHQVHMLLGMEQIRFHSTAGNSGALIAVDVLAAAAEAAHENEPRPLAA